MIVMLDPHRHRFVKSADLKAVAKRKYAAQASTGGVPPVHIGVVKKLRH
jgi:hypothetical protein